MSTINLSLYRQLLDETSLFVFAGRVTRVVGLIIEVKGIHASIGDICEIEIAVGKKD
jgi:flagellar biosynthesis/type III secretory pathway ATPase